LHLHILEEQHQTVVIIAVQDVIIGERHGMLGIVMEVVVEALLQHIPSQVALQTHIRVVVLVCANLDMQLR